MPSDVADAMWLENLQIGSVYLGDRCSATMVTRDGLLVTNYACAQRLVRSAWTIEHVPLEEGFYARDMMYERHVPGLHADHLVSVQTVNGEAPADTLVETDEGLMLTRVRPNVDSTAFNVYTFRRYEDVRVVMMPEEAIASFGGAPDEGTYPRYSLSFGLLRAYDEDGVQVITEQYLPLSASPVYAGVPLHSVGGDGDQWLFGTGEANGFVYNGTEAPPATTLFGLFDLHHSHQSGTAWRLPEAWLAARGALDLSAQLNIVASTPCAINGASLVNEDLEVVGIAFDRTTVGGTTYCIATASEVIINVLWTLYDAARLGAELEDEGIDI